MVIVIQPDFRQALTDRFGLPFHLHSGIGQLAGLLVAHDKIAAHLLHGMEQAVELGAVGVGALGVFIDLAFHTRRQAGNVLQVLAGVLHLLDTGVQVCRELANLLNHLGSALLDIRHHHPDFIGGRGRAARQPTHFIRHHGEPATVLTGPRRLNRGVERQQVGLAGDGLNHQGHPLDFFTALAQGFNQLPTGIGALAELVHTNDRLGQHFTAFSAALMGLAGRLKGLATELRGDLFSADHHFGTADDLLGRAQLRLHSSRQLLD